jgi:hypothetical protein
MMVVMTVMVARLHLIFKISGNPDNCQIVVGFGLSRISVGVV